MGNFAENLNLGNRVRPPPPPILTLDWIALPVHYYLSFWNFWNFHIDFYPFLFLTDVKKKKKKKKKTRRNGQEDIHQQVPGQYNLVQFSDSGTSLFNGVFFE